MDNKLSIPDGIDVGVDTRQHDITSDSPFAPVVSVYRFFGGGGRAATLESILAALGTDQGCLYVHGEAGSGKTMLASVLATRCQSSHSIIYCDDDELTVASLLRRLAVDLCPGQVTAPADTRRTPSQSRSQSMESQAAFEAVVSRLAQGTPGDKPVLLLVDSPARLRPAVQRLIDDICTASLGSDARLQAIVFDSVDAGTVRKQTLAPESAAAMRNHFWLRRLTLAEIGEYLQHTMLLSDFNKRHVFSREMTYFIADRSGGVFSAINQLARSAFAVARLDGVDRPGMSHLLVAGLPTHRDSPARPHALVRHRKLVFAMLAAFVVASTAAVVVLSLN